MTPKSVFVAATGALISRGTFCCCATTASGNAASAIVQSLFMSDVSSANDHLKAATHGTHTHRHSTYHHHGSAAGVRRPRTDRREITGIEERRHERRQLALLLRRHHVTHPRRQPDEIIDAR